MGNVGSSQAQVMTNISDMYQKRSRSTTHQLNSAQTKAGAGDGNAVSGSTNR